MTIREPFENLISDNEKLKLKQCMLTVHELFEKHKIWYSIAFGTLLGAVRHHDIIPWDDDIDLIVKRQDIDKIEIVLDELKKLGFKTEKSWKLYRVYSDDKHFIDLFVIDTEDNKIVRCYTEKNKCEYRPKDEEWWWKWFNFSETFINRRKKFHFGGLSLYGVENSKELLDFWYGDDYLTKCKTHYLKNHDTYVTPEEEPCRDLPEPQY